MGRSHMPRHLPLVRLSVTTLLDIRSYMHTIDETTLGFYTAFVFNATLLSYSSSIIFPVQASRFGTKKERMIELFAFILCQACLVSAEVLSFLFSLLLMASLTRPNY